MKKIFIISLLFLSFPLFSQKTSFNYKIDVGKPDKKERKTFVQSIIGTDESGTYVRRKSNKLTSSKNAFILEKYNLNMTKIKVVDFKAEYKGNDLTLEKTLMFNDNLLFFYSYFNKKTETRYIFYESINKNTLRSHDGLKMIAEFSEPQTLFSSGTIYILRSENDKTLACILQLPSKKNMPEQFGFHVFDNKMNSLWNKNIVLPYDSRNFGLVDYLLDDDGNIYLSGINYRGKKPLFGGSRGTDYTYHVITWMNQGQIKNDFPVKISRKFINDLKLGISLDGELICSGFYSEEGIFSIAGTFFMTIDKENGVIKKSSFKAFDEKFLYDFLSKRAKKKKSKGKDVDDELYQFSLDNIILTDDGGAVLIAEQYYTVVHTTYSSSGGYHTYTSYHYNDIIIVYIDNQGEIQWTSKIPKQQSSIDDYGYYLSYALYVSPENLYFVYNDFDYGRPEKGCQFSSCCFFGKAYKYGGLAITKVSSDGNTQTHTSIAVRKQHLTPVPKINNGQYNDALILLARSKKVDSLVKLQFEE